MNDKPIEYVGIHINSIKELDTDELVDRIQSVLRGANGFYLYSIYPNVKQYIVDNILEIHTNLDNKRGKNE